MVNMNKSDFYKLYIPALIKALLNEDNWEQFNVRSPEHFLNLPEQKIIEVEKYLDKVAGKNKFLDSVAYYFDAKSHGFDKINGVKIEIFRNNLEDKILKYKKKYEID